jgi:hypothetical protein
VPTPTPVILGDLGSISTKGADMAHRLLRALTFSNVCSFLALTIALGTGTAYAANTVFSTDIVDGEVKTADLATNAVTTGKIKSGGVTLSDIAADAVDSSKILDESLTSADLGTNSVGATEIGDSTIDSGEIVDDSLLESDLATGSVRSPEIQDGQVGNGDLASDAVTGAKVANESLTLSDILGANASGNVSLSGIPNGRCSQVSFSVGAAAVGQSAIVSTGAAIQNGIVLYANRVSSAGVVEVNACNFSGGAMTAISDFPVRIVTFG